MSTPRQQTNGEANSNQLRNLDNHKIGEEEYQKVQHRGNSGKINV